MADNDSARVDAAALLDVARGYDTVADLVDGVVRSHLDRLAFDGSVAGSDYADRGRALRRAIDDVADQVSAWAGATRDVALALVVSGHRYVDADTRGAVRLW